MRTVLSNSKIYGTKSERLAMNLQDSDQIMIHFYETDSNSVYLWNGNSWIDVTIPKEVTIPVFNAQIYNNTLASSYNIVENLQDYNDWTFQVAGVDADDDITIQISLDGTNFIKPGLIDVMTGAAIDQTAANIEAPGIYKLGTVAETPWRNISIKAIKVNRETAVGTNSVTVTAIGSWA